MTELGDSYDAEERLREAFSRGERMASQSNGSIKLPPSILLPSYT